MVGATLEQPLNLVNILNIFIHLGIASREKEIFIGKNEISWIQAKSLCQRYGMQLLTPDSENDDLTLRTALESLSTPIKSTHIGATSEGLPGSIYSIYTGEVLDFDISLNTSLPSYQSNDCCDNCLQLKFNMVTNKFAYQWISCFNTKNTFVCQKVTDMKGNWPVNIIRK